MNPIMQQFKSNTNAGASAQGTAGVENLGGIGGFLTNFLSFANGFKGNPEQLLNTLVSSGRVSQQQVEQATALAKQLLPYVQGATSKKR